MLVMVLLVLAQGVQQVGLFQISVRSRSSALQERIQRSMIVFIRGILTPVRRISMPSPTKTASKPTG